MTPVFCCGFECGATGTNGQHWATSGNTTTDIFNPRSGDRALDINVSSGAGSAATNISFGGSTIVIRAYVYFVSFPTSVGAIKLVTWDCSTASPGAYFDHNTSKILAGKNYANLATDGIVVTTGQWYRVDVKVDMGANPWLIDIKVNGTAGAQCNSAQAANTGVAVRLGDDLVVSTHRIYFDDVMVSLTLGDYPLGGGYINHFIPTSDGTHNVTGANDFERSATGTDITNATTDAYTLIDDVPLKSGPISEYINLTAPPNSTDYVEVVFGPAPGISTPTIAPRTVETIIAKAKGTGTGVNNLTIKLNDNGTTNDIFNGDTTVASPTASYARKHYTTAPTGGAWTVVSGAGNFNNIRMRCLTSDAAPDPWWASAMIEAEFAEVVTEFIAQKPFIVGQSVKRSNYY